MSRGSLFDNHKSSTVKEDTSPTDQNLLKSEEFDRQEDLFCGKLNTAAGLERIRKRLLDLTTNNRLLNYRFPKGKALRVVNTAPGPLFNRLYIEGKSTPIVPVPDPERKDYEEENGIFRKPDVEKHAESLGIDTYYELKAHTGSEYGNRIQALLYPEDLESVLRKIEHTSRTTIEESGTNMLYLVFGYLEWYESLDSDKPMLSPLIILPVLLKRGEVDRMTGYFRYSLEYSGDDVTENITLREKMKQDFSLELPQLEENDTPEDYFARISEFTGPRLRWKVRWQVTLCLLSFGKLLMYLDLDPRRWPVAAPLHKHPLVTTLFEGIDRETEQTFAEEYKVDEEPAAVEIPLVYEADSCQHSALIDAMQGKNLVIEGPPGTGKSQTITNLVAAALTKGKTVLFVSEKLAALEVVRRRLDQAHLGSFCLELHSHKTQKKRLLDDIKLRMDRTFSDPYHLDKKIADLEDKRKRLNRYAHLMDSVSNNDLELTINQVLWAAEHYRIALKQNAHIFTGLELTNTPQTNAEQLSYVEEAINQLSAHLQVIGDYGPTNPWWGFFPHQLLFDDDEAVGVLLSTLVAAANDLASYLANAEENLKVPLPQRGEETGKLWDQMNKFPQFGGDEAFDLLPNIFSKVAIDVIGDFESKTKFIKDKDLEIQKCFLEPTLITDEVIQQARSMLKIAKELKQAGTPHPVIQERAMGLDGIRSDLEGALAYFLAASVEAGIKVSPTQQGFALINAVMRVASEVSLNLLKLRRPEFMEVGISETIQNASKQANDLKGERSKIEDLFVISALPPRAEIVGALRTFLSGGGTFRFFSGRWRAAKRLYRSIRRERHWFLKPEKCARELSELIKFLEARFKFEHSPDIKRIAGERFDGIDTDFTRFERLAKWYELTRNELIPFVTPEGTFRLKDVFELPEDKLEWLKSRAADAERHWSAILGANSCFESIFNTEDKPSHICFGPTINLEMVNAQVSETAAKMKSIVELFEKLCLSPESPVTVTKLLDALVRTRSLKMELTANQEAKRYLGIHYKELLTNFGPIHSVIKWCKKIEDIGLPEPILNWLLTPEALNRVSTLNEVVRSWMKNGSRLN